VADNGPRANITSIIRPSPFGAQPQVPLLSWAFFLDWPRCLYLSFLQCLGCAFRFFGQDFLRPVAGSIRQSLRQDHSSICREPKEPPEYQDWCRRSAQGAKSLQRFRRAVERPSNGIKKLTVPVGHFWRPSSFTRYINGRTASREGNSRPLNWGRSMVTKGNEAKYRPGEVKRDDFF
jgi:hypothetical protein